MFNLNGSLVRYADRFCYVGILFQSTERNIFAANYIEKADIARGIGYSVFRTEAYIGNYRQRKVACCTWCASIRT
jgi:hypothetical protein